MSRIKHVALKGAKTKQLLQALNMVICIRQDNRRCKIKKETAEQEVARDTKFRLKVPLQQPKIPSMCCPAFGLPA